MRYVQPKTRKNCIGWPVGTECGKPAGARLGPFWCEECNAKRIAYLNGQFEKLGVMLKATEKSTQVFGEAKP